MSNERGLTGGLSRLEMIVYASPAMITYLAWMPLGYVIAKFYAKYTSLDLATVGLIILIGRLFDAGSDPVVAYLSDRYNTRWGRRKPWIVASVPIFVTGFILLVSPPSDIHWSYLLVANFVLYTGWTLFEITHVAWGLELDRDPRTRSEIALLLKLSAYLGSLAFFIFPWLFNSEPGSTEFTPEVMAALGTTVLVAFPLLVYLAVSVAPRETRIGALPLQFRVVLYEMLGNVRLRFYLLGFGAWALSDGLIVGLFIVYIDSYHGLSAAEGMILLAAYLSRVLALPFALRLIRRYERRKLWVGAALTNTATYMSLLLLPQNESALYWLMCFAILAGVVDCIIGILALMLLGDIIDDDAMRTQRDKAASYKAVINFTEKTVRAIGLSGGLVIVGAGGLVVGADNEPQALLVLLIVIALGPALLNLIGAWGMSMLRFNPLSQTQAVERHL